MDRSHWRSPSFRGRSPHPRHLNPRFRGDGGNFGTPRHFPPQWQQRSPYHYQNQPRGSFSPYQPNPHSFATSTPIHGSSGGGRRPFFRGGGGGRFNKRPSFGSSSFGKGGSGDDIENWISPEMWTDPWKSFLPSQERTKFAESDFNVSSADESSRITVTSVEDTNTKFADTDFDVSESSNILKTSEPARKDLDLTSTSMNANSELEKSNTVDEVAANDEDDLEKYATDRIVYDDSSDQSHS